MKKFNNTVTPKNSNRGAVNMNNNEFSKLLVKNIQKNDLDRLVLEHEYERLDIISLMLNHASESQETSYYFDDDEDFYTEEFRSAIKDYQNIIETGAEHVAAYMITRIQQSIPAAMTKYKANVSEFKNIAKNFWSKIMIGMYVSRNFGFHYGKDLKDTVIQEILDFLHTGYSEKLEIFKGCLLKRIQQFNLEELEREITHVNKTRAILGLEPFTLESEKHRAQPLPLSRNNSKSNTVITESEI